MSNFDYVCEFCEDTFTSFEILRREDEAIVCDKCRKELAERFDVDETHTTEN